MEPERFPNAYRKAIWLFNHRHFFECHEILEPLWIEAVGPEKTFYQLLIQAAVTFVHWERNNRAGLLALERSFQQKAEALGRDSYMGLNLAALRRDMQALVEPIRSRPNVPLPEFAGMATPALQTTGFEPLACDADELRILGRQTEADQP